MKGYRGESVFSSSKNQTEGNREREKERLTGQSHLSEVLSVCTSCLRVATNAPSVLSLSDIL